MRLLKENSKTILRLVSKKRLQRRTHTGIPYILRHAAIIGSLDTNGYLHRSITDIIDDMAFGPGIEVSVPEAEEALAAVRSLEPPGIGAQDLQDCLRMQLEAMPPEKRRNDALKIINDAYDAFTMKHKHRIMSGLHMSETDATEAIELILTLNPKPDSAQQSYSGTADREQLRRGNEES